MPLKKKLRILFFVIFGLGCVVAGSYLLTSIHPFAVGMWLAFCVLLTVYYMDRYLPFVNVFSKAPNKLPKSSGKVVALTFDDGPSSTVTPRILDILKEKNVKATFFCIAKHVEQYPEIAKRIMNEGHTIANHSYSHRSLPSLSKQELGKELDQSIQTFRSVLGIAPSIFRCPKGYKSKTVQKEVEKRGMKLAGFSYPIWDVDDLPMEQLAENTLKPLKDGSIILMHDGAISEAKSNRTQLLIALPFILEEIQSRGYTFVPLTPAVLQ